MTRFLSLVLALVAAAALVGCKTTNNNSGYTNNSNEKPGVSDGVRWKDPGRANRVRNAFSTFMY